VEYFDGQIIYRASESAMFFFIIVVGNVVLSDVKDSKSDEGGIGGPRKTAMFYFITVVGNVVLSDVKDSKSGKVGNGRGGFWSFFILSPKVTPRP